MKKTVWGTPASKSSFSNAIQGRGSDAHGIWDDQMEDAWHELEEDYILGSTGSGRRPTAAVREGRGLNKQQQGKAGSATPARAAAKDSSSKAEVQQGEDGGEAAATTAGASASASAVEAGKPKRVKKKLILTGGGGGRGSR